MAIHTSLFLRVTTVTKLKLTMFFKFLQTVFRESTMSENHVFLSEGIKDEGDEEIVAEISLSPDSAIW
jgi:hypothetical protein